MKKLTRLYRHHEIRRIQGSLERDSFPRLQMSLLAVLTGGSGFFASYIFLHAGLVEMWLRYLASFGVGYLVFLFLLWLWLRTRAEDYTDVPDIPVRSSSGSDGPATCYGGEGGAFGGGGASGSFDGPLVESAAAGEAGGPVGEALGTVAEAGEFALPLAALVLIGAVFCSSLFVIYSAPMLFAELLVDGVLSASLYRRLRGLETRHWLETAVRRTAWPFILTAAIASASGWAMTLYAPEAHTIGDVVYYSKHGN